MKNVDLSKFTCRLKAKQRTWDVKNYLKNKVSWIATFLNDTTEVVTVKKYTEMLQEKFICRHNKAE